MGEALIVRRGGSGGKSEGAYVWKKFTEKSGTFIDHVVADDLNTYPTNGEQDGYYYKLENTPTGFCTWAGGTDEQIVEMLQLADEGFIDISDYWTVGDERKVALSAMSATGVGESHSAQTVTLVLMNKGGKTLTNGKECNFIVGQKNGLATSGYLNSTSVSDGGWNNCARRTWCNNVYRNAIPSSLRSIFKQHQNITANGTGTATTTSTDYFALPSEKEILGSATYANATAEKNLTQFEWYKTASNRIAKHGDEGIADPRWTRSPASGVSGNFCNLLANSNSSYAGAKGVYLIVPFGCI